MPPCHVMLENKIKGADYAATLWRQANLAKPGTTMAPEQCSRERNPDQC